LIAAGVLLLILRPFKAGDFIAAGGIQGTVEEIGLFVTRIDTLDNVRTYISNSRVFSDTIQNFSANPYRRSIWWPSRTHDANNMRQEASRMWTRQASLIMAVLTPFIAGETSSRQATPSADLFIAVLGSCA
jgi:small conductance mechanosensitive channel